MAIPRVNQGRYAMRLRCLESSFVTHILFFLAWLVGLAIYNFHAENPLLFVLPYMVPVVFFAWFHSAAWGFLFAAIATLSAIPAEYISTHTHSELIYAGITTYAQLTGAAIGMSLARRVVKNRNHT
ncbi:hypothetical protein [Halomonas salinarum]|uniref:hypothetical protein n=1 Tax=Halomonas salinarum TaxID=1158993 RepID=UPI00143B1224|nr:hypothetical protein [Halomonas salinarum]